MLFFHRPHGRQPISQPAETDDSIRPLAAVAAGVLLLGRGNLDLTLEPIVRNCRITPLLLLCCSCGVHVLQMLHHLTQRKIYALFHLKAVKRQ